MSRSTDAVAPQKESLEGTSSLQRHLEIPRLRWLPPILDVLVFSALGVLVSFAIYQMFENRDTPDARPNLLWIVLLVSTALSLHLFRWGLQLWMRRNGIDVDPWRNAIDDLYVELRQLMARSTGDPSLNPEIRSRLAQLRALQAVEAAKIRERLDEGLHLKPGSGYQALEEARRLLAQHAHPAPQDLPSSR